MIMVDKDGDGTFRATSSPVKNMTAAVNAIGGSSGHSHRSSPYSILYCKPLLSGTYRTTVGSVLCMSYGLWRRPTSAKHPLCGSIDSACGRLEPASHQCVWCPGDVLRVQACRAILNLTAVTSIPLLKT